MRRTRTLGAFIVLVAIVSLQPARAAASGFEDSMAQRMLACTGCHGKDGRSAPDGYYPRIAGKPSGYLKNQLLNFRDGRRHYRLMNGLLAPLSDSYLSEIAAYFASLEIEYPPAAPKAALSEAQSESARKMVHEGDSARSLPACTSCHGTDLTGTAPFVPGLLGLPGDYLVAQLGAWRTNKRRAQSPDCMARIARALEPAEIDVLATWLSSQPVPFGGRPAQQFRSMPPLRCGGVVP